ncbi:MAG: ATP-binding cassette domain-containing protein, partial [Candidatus Cloacimonetes bacterium]|nr:ATP-binding cassette domain-containing protein [Candidatus Cloacimonadota bacterium]
IKDNVALSQVISTEQSFEKIVQNDEQYNILKKLNILDIKDRSIETISGGQQQRVALARAAISEFEVLLADEPTGNVGEIDEQIIFSFLKELVHEKHKSVILVTHNIEKALEYADEIVIIDHNQHFGEIEENNKIIIDEDSAGKRKCKTLWNSSKEFPVKIKTGIQDKNNNEIEIINPELFEIIAEKMQRTNTANMESKTNLKDEYSQFSKGLFQNIIRFITFLLIMPLFRKFYPNKDKALFLSYLRKDIEYYYKNKIFSFFIIIFLGLFAVSLFNSWDKILYKKMNNPFVNVLLAKNDSGMSLESIRQKFITPEMRRKYSIDKITSIQAISLKFYDKTNKNEFAYISGRSIEKNDPTFEKILSTQEKTANSNYDSGLYITKKLMKRFGYDQDDRFISLNIGGNQRLIPVLSVFKFLPGDSFIVTNVFYNLLQNGCYFFEEIDKINLVSLQKNDILENKKQVEEIANSLSDDISSCLYKNNSIQISFFSPHPEEYYKSLIVDLNKKLEHSHFEIYFPPNRDKLSNTKGSYDTSWFFIHLNKINKTEELKAVFQENGIKIDLEKVSTQRDFQIISKLLQTVIILLTILAFIATLIYTRYSFYLHIFQQQRQIGIIKSLGISPKTFKRIFRSELVSFLFSIYFVAFISLILLQIINFILIRLNVVNELYIQLFDWWTFIQFSMIMLSSLFSLNQVLKKIILRSSGDLIYNRNSDEF